MKRKLIYSLLTAAVFMPALAFATPGIMKLFISRYPEVKDSQLASCRTCHLPAPVNCLNPYAVSLRENDLDFSRIEEQDADEDGISNIEEIRTKQLPGSQAQADEVFIFTNRIGAITFNHEKHSLAKEYLSEGRCANCHGDDTFPRKFYDNSSWQKIAHPLCKGCHKKSGSANAPQRCFDCHDRNAVSAD
jgi:hypothetical protein